MPLLSDSDLSELVGTLIRLQRRIGEWVIDTDGEGDRAKRFPPMWVVDAISKISKALLEISRLDTDRLHLQLSAKKKGALQLSEDQLEDGLAKLRAEILAELTAEDLAIELDRRANAS